MNDIYCTAAKFQRGDFVRTPKGIVCVTAVGVQRDSQDIIGIIYRVGRNQYWHEWQLTKVRRGNK